MKTLKSESNKRKTVWAVFGALGLALVPINQAAAFLITSSATTVQMPDGQLNSPPDNKPIKAQASFSYSGTNNNLLTIALTNLQADITSVNQLVSGLSFSTSPLLNNTLLSARGTMVTLDGNPAQPVSSTLNFDLMTAGGTPANPQPAWGISSGGTTAPGSLTTLVGTQPDYMIIGLSAGGMSGNMDPNNNNTFQPFIQDTITFVVDTQRDLKVDPVNVLSVSFYFGTKPDTTYPCMSSTPNCVTIVKDPPTVPEPGMLSLLGIGVIGYRIHIKKKRAN